MLFEQINDLVPDWSNFGALAMELLQSRTEPLRWHIEGHINPYVSDTIKKIIFWIKIQ